MDLLHRFKTFLALHFPFMGTQHERIISFWEKDGPDYDYFKQADSEEWLDVFWGAQSRFPKFFSQLDLQHTLEIACGTGRHSGHVANKIKELYLLDSSAGALQEARDRFKEKADVIYIINSTGIGIPHDIIPHEHLSAVFSYDAMVHFEKEAVESYVRDSFPLMQHGALALFHHSNFSSNPGGKFTDNPGWRNFMSQEIFKTIAISAGFEVVDSEVFEFSAPGSDCITLLRKP